MSTRTDKLLAYHNDPDTKLCYLRRVVGHREADELIRGTGWSDGRGCAVGCTLEAYDHARYPVELGVPEVLAYLEDAIFEGLPKSDANAWPELFLDAIPVGADLSLVWPRFAIWLLSVELAEWTSPESRAVVALYERRIAGDEPTGLEWSSAASDARDASDASAARAAWAASDAWAARDARAASDARDARAASYQRQAAKLLELLADAPVAQ